MDALVEALDECLKKLQSGATMDEALAGFPELASDLRPLLESASAAKSIRYELPIRPSALSLSRARFLKLAESLRQAHNGMGWGRQLRSSAALVYGLIIFCVVILGSGIVSAESLPGDIFYPVKLVSEQTRLLLANNPASRINLQENFDAQRAQEVNRLMQQERTLEVSFAGYLTRKERDQWTINGIPVVFPQNLQALAGQMRGDYIQVTGYPQSSGIFLVKEIQQRQFDINGTINAMQPDQWTISQLPVAITAATVVNGQPSIGGTANLTVVRNENGQLQAVQINIITTVETSTLTVPPEKANPTDTNEPISGENKDTEHEATPSATNPPKDHPKETALPTAGNDDNHPPAPNPQENPTMVQQPASTATSAPMLPDSTPTPRSGDDTHHDQTPGDGYHSTQTVYPTPDRTPDPNRTPRPDE